MLGLPAAEAGEKQPCPEPVDHCVRVMVKKLEHRGWVGIEMKRSEGKPYHVIQKVISDSPAERAGLQPGDELLEFNGIPYLESNEKRLRAIWGEEMVPGNTITYTISRDGERRKVEIRLAKVPEAMRAQWIGIHVMEGHPDVELPPTAEAAQAGPP
jgi:S1-C subfamily serine protease